MPPLFFHLDPWPHEGVTIFRPDPPLGTSPLATHVSKGNGTGNSISLTQVAEQRLSSAGNKLLKFQLIDEHAQESGGIGCITFSSCTGGELAPSGGYTRVFLSWRGFLLCSRTLEILHPSVNIPEPTRAPHPCIYSRFAWAVHPKSPRLVSAVSTNTASGSVVLPPALAPSIPGDHFEPLSDSERFLDRNTVSGSDLSTCSFRLYPTTPDRDPTSSGVFFSTTIAQPPRGSVDRELDRSGICCRSSAWRMNPGTTDFWSKDTARARLLVLNDCYVGGERGDLLHTRFSLVDRPRFPRFDGLRTYSPKVSFEITKWGHLGVENEPFLAAGLVLSGS